MIFSLPGGGGAADTARRLLAGFFFSLLALLPSASSVAAGTAGIAAIGWAASRPYLMVTSLFPGPAESAGGAVLALSSVLLFSALFSALAAVRSARF